MRAVAAGLVALALALAGCGDVEPSSPTAADLRAIDMSPDHRVVVDEGGYRPDALDLVAGEVVLLVNEGDDDHSFTGDDHEFDTGRMHPGEETTLVLTEPGEVEFHDAEAPDHGGSFTVRAAG